MRTLYFDSSYLFRVYSQESGHEAVKALLPEAETIASALHARAEFAATILRRRREGVDRPEFLEELHQQFRSECYRGHVRLLALTDPVFARLESALNQVPATTFLRASDALHLACAAEHGFSEVYSNDRHFLAAAQLFGLRGINVIRG